MRVKLSEQSLLFRLSDSVEVERHRAPGYHGRRRREARGRFQCGARLAFAEWNRSPGIWDADGKCTNRDLLAVVDEVLCRAEEDPSTCRNLDRVIALAMSPLMEEFLRVRVWDASQLRDPPTGSRPP